MPAGRFRIITLCVWALAAGVTAAGAQTATATLAADVQPLGKLTLSATSLTFPDADPDLVPQVPAAGGPLTITAKGRAHWGTVITLTVQADDDLRSGVTVIPASTLSWTANGTGFVDGTLNRTTAAVVASWSSPGVHGGTQQWSFANSWLQPAGTYTLTLLYTLTAP